jgi:uncharacterized repeat protein (TIGR03803 family)
MQCKFLSRRRARPTLPILVSLVCTTAAHAADTYVAGGQLTIPELVIGSASYSNVVVTIGAIISGPAGSAASGTVDRYDPGTNELTVQAVNVGSSTFYNVVVTVADLVSIGSVTGADNYDGARLDITSVQLGDRVYSDVVITEALGNVIGVAGGMPTAVPDTYNAPTNELSIPAVQVGNHVYTNVLLTAGTVLHVGGFVSTNAETVLHAFTAPSGGAGGSPDGATPMGLVEGSDGNFYGTTSAGGTKSLGTVFRMTAAGSEALLYSFAGYPADGAVPEAGLVQAGNGDFYGTTYIGGTSNVGTVFAITPAGSESMIHAFSGTPGDGSNPRATLVSGRDGNFYGTTRTGGSGVAGNPDGNGTVFGISPEGAESVLYSFAGPSGDGATPLGNLVQGGDGSFYGIAGIGGADGFGIVFKVNSAGAESVLYSFAGRNGDGSYPLAGLVLGGDGNFYGTTSDGGTVVSGAQAGSGTVFRISPEGAETVLYRFGGSTGGPSQPDPGGDGQHPDGTLVRAHDGNFYGITSAGGVYGEGTVFKITPAGVETVIYSFTASSGDGAAPNSLILGSDGNLYGTTSEGGVNGQGTVFRIAL